MNAPYVTADEAAVRDAETLAEQTEDDRTRRIVQRVVDAYRTLRRGYVFLLHEGKPEPPASASISESDPLRTLSERWRTEADSLQGYGAERLADTARRHADQLEAAVLDWGAQPVTLQEAEEIGGYSYSHLQRLVSDGTLLNVGAERSPRIQRRDVPVKPGHGNAGGRARTKLEVLEGSLGR